MKFSKKHIYRIIFSLIFIGLLIFLFLNENGILRYLKLKSELNKLENEIQIAELKLKAMNAEIDSLLYNKVKIEKVARERYHMFAPNENVFKVEEK